MPILEQHRRQSHPGARYGSFRGGGGCGCAGMGSDKTEIWYVIRSRNADLGDLSRSPIQNTIWQHTHDQGVLTLGSYVLFSSVLFRIWTRRICPLIWLIRPLPTHINYGCTHLTISIVHPDSRSASQRLDMSTRLMSGIASTG